MKRIFLLFTFLVAMGLHDSNAQVSTQDILSHVDTSQEPVNICGAPTLDPSHPQAALAYQMRNRLSSTLPNVHLIVYASLEVNAHTYKHAKPGSGGLICIPQGMVVFLQEAPDELAAVIAHEMGHAIDDACRIPMRSMTAAQQQECENRADGVGFTILVSAGFNPAAMAGALGRLEGFYGGTSTGLVARINNWNNTHPITPDRIEHVHQMLLAWGAKQ